MILSVMSLLTLFAPIPGVIFTVVVLRREWASSRRPLRATLWVVLAVRIVLLGSPYIRYGGVGAYFY